MFDSIYSSSVTTAEFFLMAGVAVLSGVLFAWIMARRVRSTKRFFTVVSLIPFVVGAVITFVNGNIGAGVAIGGAFSLIRFRSAQHPDRNRYDCPPDCAERRGGGRSRT